MKREVSREGIEYLQKLRKNTPFGTNDFDLEALRAGMGSRREPTIKDVKLIKVKVGDIPCEWVLAPGADPDLRLLYLHGGGFVSGSGGFYLAQAAHISAAAKCAVLLPDYRLAPEHPFPAGLDDCVLAHEWMVANGPAGPGPARATFVAGDSAGGSLTLATLLALRDRKTAAAGGRNRPVADHRFDAGERFAARRSAIPSSVRKPCPCSGTIIWGRPIPAIRWPRPSSATIAAFRRC